MADNSFNAKQYNLHEIDEFRDELSAQGIVFAAACVKLALSKRFKYD